MKTNQVLVVSIGAMAVLMATTVAHAVHPSARCESGKLKEAAKYGACRLKVDAKVATTGDAADYSKCEERFTERYTSLETKSGVGICPTEGDEALVNTRIIDDTAELAIVLAGGVLPACGDGVVDIGEQCDGINLSGANCAAFGFSGGTLGCDVWCSFELSGCIGATCGNGIADSAEQCDGLDLAGATCSSLGYSGGGVLGCTAGCGFDTTNCACAVAAGSPPPVTGQDRCFNTYGVEVLCAGTGQDGDVQAGGIRSFTDNADGTITDNLTGLVWEKLSNDESVHDKDNLYSWTNAFSQKIETLNATSFAGHNDWRVPNRFELETLLNLNSAYSSAFSIFATSCPLGCTNFACSCTSFSHAYLSSTSMSGSPAYVWLVALTTGEVVAAGKDPNYPMAVRAVRGGL